MARTAAPRRTRTVSGAGTTGHAVAGAAVTAVALGAERASGERAIRQRRTTPLLADREAALQLNGATAAAPARTATGVNGATAAVPARTARGRSDRAKPITAPGPAATTPVGGAATIDADDRVARGERLIAVASAAEEVGEELADALRAGPRQLGELEERFAGLLELLRRRLTGDYEIDEFGFDVEFTDRVLFALLRPLYRRWFRVEVAGIENIPDTGGALVVANHSGAVALDALITSLAVHDEHPAHRFLRALGADLVFQTPFVGELARKGGATLASNADAERLLGTGQLVGVWPEGFKGVGKPFRERYKLQRFGRGGFVSAALRTRTPIVPCSIVGAEETYPIIGNLPTLARLLGLPYVPVTPTWPWLGPLGMIPLPSKWLIEFGPPVATDELGPGAADDPMLVFDLTDQIRQTIQQTLYSLLIQRRSVFF